MKDAILKALKTAYKALGFDEKVFLGVAEALDATGLITEENLESAIAGAKPALTSFQAELDRRVNAQKAEIEKAKKQAVNPEKEQGADPEPTPTQGKDDDEATKLLKMIAEQQKSLGERLAAIEGGKIADTRKQQLQAKLNDAPEFLKNKILKDFARMKFDSDEEFSTYLEETEADIKDAVQAAANEGLGQTSKPIIAGGTNEKDVSSDMKAYLKSKKESNERNQD